MSELSRIYVSAHIEEDTWRHGVRDCGHEGRDGWAEGGDGSNSSVGGRKELRNSLCTLHKVVFYWNACQVLTLSRGVRMEVMSVMDERPEDALGLPTRPSSDDTSVVRMLVALERPPVSEDPSMPEEPVLDEPVPVLDEPVPELDEPVPELDEPVPVLDEPVPVLGRPVVAPVAPSEKKK